MKAALPSSWLAGSWPLGLLLAALVVNLGGAPPQRAEIYFLDVARAMCERGDWLVPYYRGLPFFDKPPLAYWLMAASFTTFGFEAWAARLVSVLATLVTLAGTFLLGERLFGARSALAGTLVLAATPAFVIFGRLAMADMLLAACSTLAVALALRDGPLRPVVLGALLGLGFLTKGPIALLFPGLLLALLARRHQRAAWPGWGFCLAALLPFAFVGLSWFALIWLRLGSEPLVHFFWQENFQRFGGEVYNLGRGPGYYPVSYLLLGFPFSLFLPLAAWRLRHESGSRALLLWLLLCLGLLTLSRGKLDYYLLPLYPAASLLIGRLLADTEWRALERRWVASALGTAAVAALGLALIVPRLPIGGPARAWSWGASGLAVLAGVLLWSARRAGPAGVARASATTLGLILAAYAYALPSLWAARPNAALVATVAAERARLPAVRVVACDDPAQLQRDLLFRLRLVVHQTCDLAAAALGREPTLLIVHDAEHDQLTGLAGLRPLQQAKFLPAKTLYLLARGDTPAHRRITLVANYPPAGD